MNKKLGNGILAILFANIINLFFNLITNFLLPKYLSVDTYSAIKTFQLYGMYIGIFSLGCADGMYLRYGGRCIEEIDKAELRDSLFTFRLFLFLESIVFLILAGYTRDSILMATVLTILSLNMTGYYKNIYQASGEFSKYGNITNLSTFFTFILNFSLLFIAKTDYFFNYLIGYVVIDAIIWLLLEYYANKNLINHTVSPTINKKLFIADAKNGITLMVGNFASTLLSSMDRWFVKVMMASIEFAQYSFSVSLEGFLNTAITPVTVTLYNYFCNRSDKETVVKIRKLIFIFSSFLISAAFPAKFIIERFLGKYNGSIQVLFILFSAQLFFVPIKGVYVNLYKAKARQNTYFLKLVLVLTVGAMLNYLMVLAINRKEAFAYGTLLSALLWLVLCICDFRAYVFSIQETVYIVLVLASFLFLGLNTNPIVGFISYITFILLAGITLFHKEYTLLVNRFLKRQS